jgi:hypothetical protein
MRSQSAIIYLIKKRKSENYVRFHQKRGLKAGKATSPRLALLGRYDGRFASGSKTHLSRTVQLVERRRRTTWSGGR